MNCWHDVAASLVEGSALHVAIAASRCERRIENFGQVIATAGAMQAMYDAGYRSGWVRYAEVRWRPNTEGRSLLP